MTPDKPMTVSDLKPLIAEINELAIQAEERSRDFSWGKRGRKLFADDAETLGSICRKLHATLPVEEQQP